MAKDKVILESKINVGLMSPAKLMQLARYGEVLEIISARTLPEFKEAISKMDDEKLEYIRAAMYEIARFAYAPIKGMAKSLSEVIAKEAMSQLEQLSAAGAEPVEKGEQAKAGPPDEVIDHVFDMAFKNKNNVSDN